MMKVMPSATNLFGAAAMAILALIVSVQIPAVLPEDTHMGSFNIVNMVIGLIMGWTVVGRRTGRGWVPGINAGLTGVVMLVFWGLFVQGCYEMVRRAMRNRYDSAFEALVAVFELMVEWFLLMLNVPIISTLLIGAVVVGLIAEVGAKRFR